MVGYKAIAVSRDRQNKKSYYCYDGDIAAMPKRARSEPEEKTRRLKSVELRLISELMKNCRRSDRELAKAIGISQPTVSRVRERLEKEGLIEYCAVPNFVKLGFEIMAITLGKRNYQVVAQENDFQKAVDFVKRHPTVLFCASGSGLSYDETVLSIHKNYADYSRFIQEEKTEWADVTSIESFLVDLKGKGIVQRLSLKNLAESIKKESESSTRIQS